METTDTVQTEQPLAITTHLESTVTPEKPPKRDRIDDCCTCMCCLGPIPAWGHPTKSWNKSGSDSESIDSINSHEHEHHRQETDVNETFQEHHESFREKEATPDNVDFAVYEHKSNDVSSGVLGHFEDNGGGLHSGGHSYGDSGGCHDDGGFGGHTDCGGE